MPGGSKLGLVDGAIGSTAFKHLRQDLAGGLEGHGPSHVVYCRAEMGSEQSARGGCRRRIRDVSRSPGSAQSSMANTSAAYPPSFPVSNASATASSSTTDPRPTLTRNAPERILWSIDASMR